MADSTEEFCLVELSAADARERMDRALDVALRFGAIDGGHHKTWVIDQMVRALTGDQYAEWARLYRCGEDGPETYAAWDPGIAP